jgi:transcriptional regulator with XRE-family HTH domain
MRSIPDPGRVSLVDGQVVESASYSTLLKAHRLGVGLSLRALAARAGISHTLVVRSETGSRPPASPQEVLALASGLGLTPADRDALLGAAGYWPGDLVLLGPADPTLLAVARLLTDESVPTEALHAFREATSALIRAVVSAARSRYAPASSHQVAPDDPDAP